MNEQEGTPAFEDVLEELEAIVERMEDGEPSLDESLRLFERGMDLTRGCQKALDEAEQRIRALGNSEPLSSATDGTEGPVVDA